MSYLLIAFCALISCAQLESTPKTIPDEKTHSSLPYLDLECGPSENGLYVWPIAYKATFSTEGVSNTNVAYLFCHGIGGNKNDVIHYAEKNILPPHATSFNFSDWHNNAYDKNRSALGQGADIRQLQTEYHELEKCGKSVVLYGLSRGASTIVNSIGMINPRRIAAVILESPFAHVDDVIQHLIPIWWLLPTDFAIQRIYPAYNLFGEQPIHRVSTLAHMKDIPVLLVCSKKDALVPYKSTLKLYNVLRAAGRTNVHILIFESGAHAGLANNQKYWCAVHAFYKKYDLPHDPWLASVGARFLTD